MVSKKYRYIEKYLSSLSLYHELLNRTVKVHLTSAERILDAFTVTPIPYALGE